MKIANIKIGQNKDYRFYIFGHYGALLFYFFIFASFRIKGINSKSNLNQDENIYDLDEQRNIFNYNLIKENPHLATDYIFRVFNDSSRLNLSLFNENVNKIKEKIYYTTKNKEANKDLYIILSSIYGAFLADSMGSNTEFRRKNENNHLLIYGEDGTFKPGQVTDDSEMAMSQSFGILDNYQYKTLNQNLNYYYYVIWFKSNPLDVGTTTRNALVYLNLDEKNINDDNIFTEKTKSKIKEKNSGSKSNGFLMRASPLLTWFYMVNKNYVNEILETKLSDKYFELYKKIHTEMEKDTQLTHPNPENAVGGSIMIFMGLCAMQEKYSGKEILEMTNILFENSYFDKESNENEYNIKNHFKNVLKEFSKPDFSKDIFFDNLYSEMGFYRHAFNLTLYYLNVFDEQKNNMSLREIYNNMMYDISDFGGDTDTNGAIVGMVMGPLIGMENFDKKYFDIFLSFYSRERLIYTNSFMYFYAKYLETIVNGIKSYDKDKYDVNYNFIRLFIKMLNEQINI